MRFLAFIILISHVSLSAKEVLLDPLKIHIQKQRLFVLSVGVSQYQDPFWPSLKWPQSDATHVSQSVGEALPYQKIEKILLGKEATQENVLKALQEIARDTNKRDSFVFYVSGHGSLYAKSGDMEKVIILHDTNASRLEETGFTHRRLLQEVEKISAQKKLLILATCHSGVGKSRLPPDVQELLAKNKGAYAPLGEVSEGSLILSASTQGETAREEDSLKSDIYTFYFLEGLEFYFKENGSVSAMQAHDYAKVQTYAYTKGKQRPTAQARFIGEGDLVLKGSGDRKFFSTLKAYKSEYEGLALSVNNRDKGLLPLSFPLQTGKNRVSLFVEGEENPVSEYEVDIQPGSTLTLEELLSGPPYTLSFGAELFCPRSQAFQNLAGHKNLTAWTLRSAWKYSLYEWALGLEVLAPSAHSVRENLTSSLQALNIQVEVGTHFQAYKRLQPSFHLLLGGQTMRLMFQDTANQESLTYTGTALSYAYRGSLSFDAFSNFALDLFFFQRWAVFDFQKLGKLDGSGFGTGLQISYRFGGKGQRL